MLASLLLLPFASAAPLGGLGGIGKLGSFGGLSGYGAASGYSAGHADFDLFASAFVNTYTGGAYGTCNNLGGFDLTSVFNVGLNLDLDFDLLTSQCHDFNGWVGGQCFSKYNDQHLCTELGSYLTATWYAWSRGWKGANFFACLGVDHVTRWQQLLGGLCHRNGCPQDQCNVVSSHWGGFCSAYTHVQASAYASLHTELQSAGIFDLIDASANLWTGTHVVGRDLETIDGLA